MGETHARHDVMVATSRSSSQPSRISRAVAKVLTLPITAYRMWISPMSGPTCRFYPSCSQYATTALSVHGAGKGTLLAVSRVCRCHPWTPGGVDMVPPVGRWRPDPYVRDMSVDSDVSSLTNEARSAE